MQMLRFTRAMICAQFLFFACFNFFFWQHLFFTTSAAPQISPEAKIQFGNLLQKQILAFQRKAKNAIVPLLNKEQEREKATAGSFQSNKFLVSQYQTILKKIGEISLKLNDWTIKQEERENRENERLESATNAVDRIAAKPVIRTARKGEDEELDYEFSVLRAKITDCKSLLKLLQLEAAMTGEVPVSNSSSKRNANAEENEEGEERQLHEISSTNPNERVAAAAISSRKEEEDAEVNQALAKAISQFRSDTSEFMDQLLLEILLLQPVEDFPELSKQIERQKQEIRQPIEDLVEKVFNQMNLYEVQHTTTRFRRRDRLLGFIPGIVKPIKKPLRKEYDALRKVLLKVIEKSQSSQHGELDALLQTFDNLLANNNPLLGPVSEEILESAIEESKLQDEMAKSLEGIGRGINEALAKIHGEITAKIKETKGAVGEEWVKEYNTLHAFELLSSISREMHRRLEATAKSGSGTKEKIDNMMSLWVLANHWMKTGLNNLDKIDPHFMGTVKEHLGMGSGSNLIAIVQITEILPKQLSVHAISKLGHDHLKMRIVLTAMHVLFLYEKLNHQKLMPYHLIASLQKPPSSSPSPSSSSSSSPTSSSSSKAPLKNNNSIVVRAVKRQVEADVVPAQLVGRLYQLFCVEFSKDDKNDPAEQQH